MNENIKKIAVSAARNAGKILLKEYKDFDRSKIKLKSHHEIVTRADLLSEEAIIKEIKRNFPAHSILSEEMGLIETRNFTSLRWIIDPLDGTTNFSMHNPLWCVSIAVAEIKMDVKSGLNLKVNSEKFEKAAEIIIGVVYAPFLDELYVVERGKGATVNGHKINVSDISEGKVLNTFCHGKKDSDIKKALDYYRKQKMRGFDCRQLGSAAIELAYVAAGRIESIVIPGANSWDVAAGVLLVNEAGGNVTDFKGDGWNLGSPDMVASNGKVHAEILKAINK